MRWMWIFAAFFISKGFCGEWEKEKAFFQEQGYLVIKKFFSKEQTKLLQNWADEVHQESNFLLELSKSSGRSVQELAKLFPQSLIVVPEAKDPSQVCRAEDMLTCYPKLLSFISGTAGAHLSTLMDEPYTLFKDKLNFKWPGGGAFLPHQDFPAYDFLGPRIHITMMISIDASTLENGCLYVAKNWRETFLNDPEVDQEKLKLGTAILPYIEGGPMHGSINSEFSDKITWTPLETEPGDVVLISSFVPHYSEPNRSQNPRRAMLFTFNRLFEGEHRTIYYQTKRNDFDNPAFHFGTPTKGRTKE